MSGIKPIGSEKLQGMDKIRRMIEISRYNENVPQNVNETRSTEYSISLADGNTYIIEKERRGYIIKMGIYESYSDYLEPMQGRKYYPSYSQALKRLNLMAKEINVLHENEEGISLIGEQKKKFVLKTKKKPKSDDSGVPPPAPADDMGVPPVDTTIPPPVDAGTPPPVDAGMPPADDMGVPPSDDMDMAPPVDSGMPPADDMGMPPVDSEIPPSDDMGMPPSDDMGMPPSDDMGGSDKKSNEKKVSDIKRIQILVGKLAQKIRSYEEEKDLSNKEVKYIVNSILSAIDVDVLDEDDIEQIIGKLEGIDNEDEEDDDVSFEEENTDIMPEPPQEPEMAEGYGDAVGKSFGDYFGGAYAAEASKNLKMEEEDFNDDNYYRERRGGRKNYPNVDRFEHGTFSESTVDRVLSKYFIINENEEIEYQQKKDRKTNQTYQLNKKNILKLSESQNQLDTSLDYISKYPRTKLIGLSTNGNLVFKEGLNEVKITRNGELL